MRRKELLAALTKVGAALAGAKAQVPIHSCYCSSGEHVFSFDDTAALVTKLALPWKGGVRGAELLGWLDAAGSKEVEFEVDGTTLKLKCGRAKSSLPILPADDFLFNVPDTSKASVLKLSPAAISAMRKASVAMGTDPQHPWRNGMQLILGDAEIGFYASDACSAARTLFPMKVPSELVGKDPLLPSRFVGLLLQKPLDGDTPLYLADDWYAADLQDDVKLFSAVPSKTDVKTFQQLFSDDVENRKKAIPLPVTWFGALNRAMVLLGGVTEAPAEFKIEDGKISIEVLSALGQSRDSFKLTTPHEPTAARLPPAIALKGKGEVTEFAVAAGPKFTFFGKDFTFVVAAGA